MPRLSHAVTFSGSSSTALAYSASAWAGFPVFTDTFEFDGNAVVALAGWTGFEIGDLFEQFGQRLSSKRHAAHEQFVEHDPEAEDVAAAIHPVPFTASLLGAHVAGSSGILWPFSDILLPQRQTEIDDRRCAVPADQDVAGLDCGRWSSAPTTTPGPAPRHTARRSACGRRRGPLYWPSDRTRTTPRHRLA